MPAYLVAWKEGHRVVDAGIYSEPSPTPKFSGPTESTVLLTYTGSYHEAVARLRSRVKHDRNYVWVREMSTYRMQETNAPILGTVHVMSTGRSFRSRV